MNWSVREIGNDLGVRADNLCAIRCYEKAGFQVMNDFYENHIKMHGMRMDKVY
jgi:ribosomal protein S18 acetylase RimI-like enzyme